MRAIFRDLVSEVSIPVRVYKRDLLYLQQFHALQGPHTKDNPPIISPSAALAKSHAAQSAMWSFPKIGEP